MKNETQAFIDRPGIINIVFDYEDGFLYNSNKVAIKSVKNMSAWTYPVYKLLKCEVCGRLGTGKMIQHRSDMNFNSSHGETLKLISEIIPAAYIDYYHPKRTIRGYMLHACLVMRNKMCWSCYNKIRPTVVKLQELVKTGLFLRNNKKEIAYEKQHQNN